jgi:hypothetical protein
MSGSRLGWTKTEEIALAQVFVDVHKVSITGGDVTTWDFWNRFKNLLSCPSGRDDHYRSTGMLTSKWCDMRL